MQLYSLSLGGGDNRGDKKKMSKKSIEIAADEKFCANCGVTEIDEIKLKPCDKCDLVSYCSDECQLNHEEVHEIACKERAAELRDEILFKQPESSHLGDCPICFLPMPLDKNLTSMQFCCSKLICLGCYYANSVRAIEKRLKQQCPFCRKNLPKTDDEIKKNLEKRVEKNDTVALREIGLRKRSEGDYYSAYEYLSRSAALGDVVAMYNLSLMHHYGHGVERDEERARYYLDKAAISGDVEARYFLGLSEVEKRRYDRAAKHWIISSKLGHVKSIKRLKDFYKAGYFVSKDDFALALRAHKAAVNATKSPQREAAEKFFSKRDQ